MLKKFNLTNPYSKYCPNCDYIFSKKEKVVGELVCPRCGAERTEPEKGSATIDLARLAKITVLAAAMSLVFLLAGFVYLYFNNEAFAAEIRNLRQPRPNNFTIGIDVSQTIRPDILSDFKTTAAGRLQQFVGEKNVRYQITLFGIPGCNSEAIRNVLTMASPADETAFARKVAKPIDRIAIAYRGEKRKHLPLTTPLHGFLKASLPKISGKRIIILSDLVNDDTGCSVRHPFPRKTLEEFGKNKEGQLFFFYPPPYLFEQYHTPKRMAHLVRQQQAFIDSVTELTRSGKLRAYFYPIPEDAPESTRYLGEKLQGTIPATTYEVVRERIARIVQTIVYGIRG